MIWTIEAGESLPLGAFPVDSGVNFSIFSAAAERVELCIYDALGAHELARLTLPERQGDLWHGFVPHLEPGYCYGYRVYGPYDPSRGLRFNANKLLVDPYAKALVGDFCWNLSHFGYEPKDPLVDLSFNKKDNAQYQLKGRIVDCSDQTQVSQRDWHVADADRVLYELHIKGFTQLSNAIPNTIRGRLSALATPQILAHLKSLGVTTLELMPVHAFINDRFLHKRKLTNYWGYNSLNFFAPHQAYLESGDPFEFRRAVDQIHEAGFEVILDVVYNHTAESDQFGPTLSFRGIDNASYYRLAEDKRLYVNDTGCGNTLNLSHPRVVQMVTDSLRYWVSQMGVDGFRFDLASILGRHAEGFDAQHTMFQVIAQDPILSQVKLYAEPWDIGPGGYQLGQFPAGWSEWNDRYRDTVRRFWRGDQGVLPDFAKRLHGSADIFESRHRAPKDSLNFITSHDGFTLRDLVSYKDRHNLANGEHNRDGHHENLSANYGVEGETSDQKILTTRLKLQKNMLLTLMVSQGTPMLLAGDEFGRTQQGNNNAYCQDNEINWLDWATGETTGTELLIFTQRLIALRKSYQMLRQNFYIHQPDCALSRAIHWFDEEGRHMSPESWLQPDRKALVYLLKGDDRELEASLLVLFNSGNSDKKFVLPQPVNVLAWLPLISSCPKLDSENKPYLVAESLVIASHSAAIFLAQSAPKTQE